MISDMESQSAGDPQHSDQQLHEAHREKMRSRSRLQGSTADFGSEAARQRALQDAFEYRGDVALLLADDAVIVGYIFDRIPAGPAEVAIQSVRLYTADSDEAQQVDVEQIRGLKFSGRDFATGAAWEARQDKLNSKKKGAASDQSS